MIRRYIIWRNNHAYDERLRRIVDRANQLDAALASEYGCGVDSVQQALQLLEADGLAERPAGQRVLLSPEMNDRQPEYSTWSCPVTQRL